MPLSGNDVMDLCSVPDNRTGTDLEMWTRFYYVNNITLIMQNVIRLASYYYRSLCKKKQIPTLFVTNPNFDCYSTSVLPHSVLVLMLINLE